MSRILAGPTCTQLLGDYGADVIKIEKPGSGDDTRNWGPPFMKNEDGEDTNESGYFLASNRNKRSLSLDISKKENVGIIKALLKDCDVFIENFKVGSLKKYGLDYHSLSEEFPQLIYCSITGYGQAGPNSHKAGYDLIAQGYGGLMSITGSPNEAPVKVGVAVADLLCGLYACTAILAALNNRSLSGTGQNIDIALVDAQIASLVNMGTNYLLSKQDPARVGNEHANIVPYQVFEVSDGHLNIAIGNDEQFRKFCDVINRSDLSKNQKYSTNIMRVSNRSELIPILKRELKTHKKNDLVHKMEKMKVPGGPINKLSEVFASNQVSEREMKIQMKNKNSEKGFVELIGNPVKFSKTPVSYRHPPPFCGEHSDEILNEIMSEKVNSKIK
jgi:crotonobetainyl-CoA:carnitine CoA-transferase CaiB-like acyl-CoA transferase